MIRTVLIASTALGLAATASLAQSADPQSAEPQAVQPMSQTPTYAPQGIDAAPELLDVTTKDDAKVFASSEFARADGNLDGQIDQTEFTAYLTAAKSASVEASVMPGETAVAEAEIAAEISVEEPKKAFDEIAKGEAGISETALIEAREANFVAADANGDAELNESEKQVFAALVLNTTQP